MTKIMGFEANCSHWQTKVWGIFVLEDSDQVVCVCVVFIQGAYYPVGLCLRENVSQEISRREVSRVSVSRGYMFRVFVLSSIVTT